MADTGSVRIVKEFTYRNGVRRFSNRYHIGTAVPPDSAHWTTLIDNIVNAEKLLYNSFATGGAKIVEGVGYAPGSDVPVFNKVYNQDGGASHVGGAVMPGDVAALIRYSTPDYSTKHHPVYLFNYYHAIAGDGGNGNQDKPHPGAHTALGDYATAWMTGFSDGVTTFHRSRPSGDLATGFLVQTYFTHRDLRH